MDIFNLSHANHEQFLTVICLFPFINELSTSLCLLAICISSVIALPILQNRFLVLVYCITETVGILDIVIVFVAYTSISGLC